MTPEQLGAQLPHGYGATLTRNDHHVEVVQTFHRASGQRSQPYPLADANLALGWALDHASRYDANPLSEITMGELAAQLPKGYTVQINHDSDLRVRYDLTEEVSGWYRSSSAQQRCMEWAERHQASRTADHAERNQPSNELCAVTIPSDEDRAAAAAIALPEGYAIRIRGALGNTPQQYRAIYPDKDGRTLHPTAELAAQDCIRHYITQHTRSRSVCPPGYQVTEASPDEDSAVMHVVYPDGETSDLMDYTYEKLYAHAWDHFEAQPDRKDCPPGYRVVDVSDGEGETWEVIHPTGPDGVTYQRREWAVAAARDFHHLLMAREEFRRLGKVKGEPGTAQGSIEERLAAARAQLPEKYQIDPVGSRFRVSFYGAITGRDRKTPEAALSWAQRHEAYSRIRLEEGVEHSHRDKIAALIQPHPNMTAEGRLSGNGSGANTYSMWRLYYCNAVSPWFSIIVLDNLKLNIADLFNVQPQEVTAMTHPAHTGPALNEIKKMIQLLENGEWADTFPTHAEGQRLEKVINALVGKANSSQSAYQEMEDLRARFEANDIDALKAFEPKHAITSVWQTTLYDRMQECAKREAELRRLLAETDLKAISASEPAPVAQPYYTLEDKIVDLAIDVIAGTAHPERAKVLLREIIKEAKA